MRRYYFVEWDDYLAAGPTREYGVADTVTGYYLRLPSGWRGAVTFADGPFENSLCCAMRRAMPCAPCA